MSGWYALHARFGKLPMKALLAPAIHYAREGFPVTEVIAAAWARNLERLEAASEAGDLTNFRETYLIDGRPPRHGQVFRNPDAGARRSRCSPRAGRDAFYHAAPWPGRWRATSSASAAT